MPVRRAQANQKVGGVGVCTPDAAATSKDLADENAGADVVLHEVSNMLTIRSPKTNHCSLAIRKDGREPCLEHTHTHTHAHTVCKVCTVLEQSLNTPISQYLTLILGSIFRELALQPTLLHPSIFATR